MYKKDAFSTKEDSSTTETLLENSLKDFLEKVLKIISKFLT